MKAIQKKLICAAAVGGALVLTAVGVTRSGWLHGETKGSNETEAVQEAYQTAAADVTFWYTDDTYTEFFSQAALAYYEKTGIKVNVQRQETLDYIGTVYDATMGGEAFPDVYLIAGDNLEEVYRYGLAAENKKGLDGVDMAKNAVAAATYRDKLLGYPLGYNTCVFVYQTDYFETAPNSLQALIDYSNQNEPPENVEYLLEWDVNDAFYDFPFISNSVTFEKTEPEVLNVIYDQTLYQQDLDYFATILQSFSIDKETVSEESILDNFRNGRTLSALIDTSSLKQLEGYGYSLMKIPALNETLPAYPCATTDMLVVNDFSDKGDAAADFAHFATVTMAEQLHALSGHYSVIPSKEPDWVEQVAYESYESAILAPNSVDARDFWVALEETISKYF